MATKDIILVFKAQTKQFTDSLKGGTANMNALKLAGVGAFVAMSAAAVAFTADAIKVGAGFEAAMTQARAVSGATQGEFDTLSAKARELGASTAFSATEAAGGFINLARAGMDVADQMLTIEPALKLAGASETDLNTTSAALVSTLSQFNLEADQSARVADVFANAASNSQFSVAGLADSMKYAGPTGFAFGESLEDTTAALMQFRNLGLDASQAGTTYRMAVAQMHKGTDGQKAALGRLGLTMEDISLKTHSWGEVLDIMAGKMNEQGTAAEDAGSIMGEVFGTRAGGSIAGLVKKVREGTNEFNKFRDSVKETGTVNEQYGMMMDTMQGAMDIFKSAMEELKLKLFDLVGGPFKALVEVGTWLVNFIGTDFGQAITAGVVLVGFLTAGFIALNFALLPLMPTIIATAAAAWTALAPVLPIILAISGAVAVGILIFKAFKNNVFGMKDAFNKLVDGLKVVWTYIKAVGMVIADYLRPVFEGIKIFFAQLWADWKPMFTAIGRWFSDLWLGITTSLSDFWDSLKWLFEVLKPWFKKLALLFILPLAPLLSTVALIVAAFGGLDRTIGAFVLAVGRTMDKLVILLKTALNPKNWLKPSVIKDAFVDLASTVGEGAKKTFGAFKEDLSAMGESMKGMVGDVQRKAAGMSLKPTARPANQAAGDTAADVTTTTTTTTTTGGAGTGTMATRQMAGLMRPGGVIMDTTPQLVDEMLPEEKVERFIELSDKWTEAWQDGAKAVSSYMGSAYKDLITGATNIGEAIKGLFSTMLDSIVTSIANAAAEMASNWLFTAVLGPAGGLLGGLFSGLGSKHSGGYVGETGPRVLQRGEYVINSESMRNPRVAASAQQLNQATGSETSKTVNISLGGRGLEKEIYRRDLRPGGALAEVFKELNVKVVTT